MDRVGFRTFLVERKTSEGAIAHAFAVAERFESYVCETLGTPVGQASGDVARSFSSELVKSDGDPYESCLALLRFGRFVRNHDVTAAMLEMLDGHAALENLWRRVGDELGAPARDRVFAGVEIPPVEVSNVKKARRMQKAVERLEAVVGSDRCGRLIGQGLHDIPDGALAGERIAYEKAGGLDGYLRRKGDLFIAELKAVRDEGSLYFSQPITDEVIAYVEAHPEIRQGVRVGDVLYEAKIPYMAAEYLRETDPQLKAYYCCHCPWARESLRRGEKRVSKAFCNCSAALHKKLYEVIFGQELEAEVVETVLAGDPWCKFAIRLPKGVA